MSNSELAQFQVDEVLFFGRSVDEYKTMFNLEYEKMGGLRVLDCSAGPAALAARARQWSIDVVACDPLYGLPLSELRKLVDNDVETVRSLQLGTRHLFEEALRKVELRKEDMILFLNDYQKGKQEGRYIPGTLPRLPFPDNSFDVALCGNFLFLYSGTENGGMMRQSPYDFNFHLESLRELCRVSRGEVRVYPLHGPDVTSHPFLDDLCDSLATAGIECRLVPVNNTDIKTATKLLSLRRI